jgi:hypothetical protein
MLQAFNQLAVDDDAATDAGSHDDAEYHAGALPRAV